MLMIQSISIYTVPNDMTLHQIFIFNLPREVILLMSVIYGAHKNHSVIERMIMCTLDINECRLIYLKNAINFKLMANT